MNSRLFFLFFFCNFPENRCLEECHPEIRRGRGVAAAAFDEHATAFDEHLVKCHGIPFFPLPRVLIKEVGNDSFTSGLGVNPTNGM